MLVVRGAARCSSSLPHPVTLSCQTTLSLPRRLCHRLTCAFCLARRPLLVPFHLFLFSVNTQLLNMYFTRLHEDYDVGPHCCKSKLVKTLAPTQGIQWPSLEAACAILICNRHKLYREPMFERAQELCQTRWLLAGSHNICPARSQGQSCGDNMTSSGWGCKL